MLKHKNCEIFFLNAQLMDYMWLSGRTSFGMMVASSQRASKLCFISLYQMFYSIKNCLYFWGTRLDGPPLQTIFVECILTHTNKFIDL